MYATSSKAALKAAGVFYFIAAVLSAVSPSAYSQERPATAEPEAAANSKASSTVSLKNAARLCRTGKFEEAIAEYGALLKDNLNFAEAYAGMTRCYLKAGKVQEAFDSATRGVKAVPDSQAVQVALGEVYFRQGKMHEAEEKFLQVTDAAAAGAPVLRSGNAEARAYLGLARVSAAASMHAWAKQMLEKAHALDPDDPEIERRWLEGLPLPERIKALTDYLAGNKIEDAEVAEEYKIYLQSLQRQENLPAHECRLVSGPAAVETYLWPMFLNPPYRSGYGLDVKINRRGSRLLLDTGVSGVLLSPATAARAGIIPRSQSKIMGIGDKWQTDLYLGYADSIKVGPLEFRNCPVEVSAKETAGHDGLIGPDLFSHYLVTLDFPGQLLKLSQLPKPADQKTPADLPGVGPPKKTGTASPAAEIHNEDGYGDDLEDRYVAPSMESYTKVFRFGHMLLVPTGLNNFSEKLFLMDTGSNDNNISIEAAREVTKLTDDPDTKVIGINGKVIKVYRADKINLSFGRYKHEHQDVVVFDLSGVSQATGTEISGILGFALLRLLKITIDYRDGLVDFSYDSRRVH